MVYGNGQKNQLRLIGPTSTRKSQKVVGVFDLMDKKGMSTLKALVDEIRQQRLTGMGIIRKKSKAKTKAKAKGKAIKHEFALGGPFAPTQPITHPMPNTGLQPQLYKQQLTTPTTITPQLAPQLTQQIAQPIAQPVAQPVATTAPATTGAGKFKKPRAKAKSKKLKPIKEEEEITIIKPPKMTLDYIDLNNDPYLINRIR